jgi:hypothetical protein
MWVMCPCVGVASQMCEGAFGPGEVEPHSAKSRRQALLHSAFAGVFRPAGPRGAENFKKQDSPIIRRARGPNSLSVGLTVEIWDGALTFVSFSNRTHSPLRLTPGIMILCFALTRVIRGRITLEGRGDVTPTVRHCYFHVAMLLCSGECVALADVAHFVSLLSHC